MFLNKHSAGYSLLEFVVSLGLSVMVLMLSLDILMKQQVLFNEVNEKIGQQDAQTVTAKMGRLLESAGGLGLMPWQAIHLENNCAARADFPDCQGSDRITVVTPLLKADHTTYKARSVTEYAWDKNQVTIPFDASGICPSLAELAGQVIALYDSLGTVVIAKVDAYDEAGCLLQTSLHQQSSVITTSTTTSMSELNSSTLIVVKVITYFFDRTRNKILRFTDKNNNGILDADEVTELFSDIYEFQLSLGYDFNPRDGGVQDDPDPLIMDEFLHNFADETMGGAFNPSPSDLRMIKIGVAVGSPTKGIKSGAFRMMDGPTVTPVGLSIKRQSKSVIFRNLTRYIG